MHEVWPCPIREVSKRKIASLICYFFYMLLLTVICDCCCPGMSDTMNLSTGNSGKWVTNIFDMPPVNYMPFQKIWQPTYQ
jgi:hypothetical protein